MCLPHSLGVLWLNDNAHWIGWISALWTLCQCFWESVTDVLLRMWMRYESIRQQAPIWCLFLWSSPSYSSKVTHTKLYGCLFDARKHCFLSQWWGLELALCRWYSLPSWHIRHQPNSSRLVPDHCTFLVLAQRGQWCFPLPLSLPSTLFISLA